MEILYDTLKFYLKDESEFKDLLEDARLNGIELTMADGDYPAQYPVLFLANSTFIDRQVVSAKIFYAYPEDWAGKVDPASKIFYKIS